MAFDAFTGHLMLFGGETIVENVFTDPAVPAVKGAKPFLISLKVNAPFRYDLSLLR